MDIHIHAVEGDHLAVTAIELLYHMVDVYLYCCIVSCHPVNLLSRNFTIFSVLGANQFDIFFKVTIPATTPFILVAARLGLSTSMTTLMASEIVGGDKGIGIPKAPRWMPC